MQPFTTSSDHVEAATNPHHGKHIAAEFIILAGILTIAGVGAALSYAVGGPKAFFLIMASILLWFVGGWFLVRWRTVLVVLTALAAALAASDQTYVAALLFIGASYFLHFVEVAPRSGSR